jgi:branched-subunit amino acid transport protein|tara:strand:+ start:281 stop:475 length:195 start_codon:yes stop_codon:yes gene_type:complete
MAIKDWLRNDPQHEVSDLDFKRDMSSLVLTLMLASLTVFFTDNLTTVLLVGIAVYTFLRYVQRG